MLDRPENTPPAVAPIRSYADAERALARARACQMSDAALAVAIAEEVLHWARAKQSVSLQARAQLVLAAATAWTEGTAAALRHGNDALLLFDMIEDASGAADALGVLVSALHNSNAYATCVALIERARNERRLPELTLLTMQVSGASALCNLGEYDAARALLYETVIPGTKRLGANASYCLALYVASFLELATEDFASNVQSVNLLNRAPSNLRSPLEHARAALRLLDDAEPYVSNEHLRMVGQLQRFTTECRLHGYAATDSSFEALETHAAGISDVLHAMVILERASALRIDGQLLRAAALLDKYEARCTARGEALPATAVFERAIVAEQLGHATSANEHWRAFARARIAWSTATHAWFNEFGVRAASTKAPVDASSAGTLAPQSHSLAREFIEVAHRSCLEKRSVAWYAKQLGTSQRHLTTVVTSYRGETPKRVLVLLRLEQARKMLEQTSVGIADIADFAGYSSPSAFSADFKALYLEPPSAVRARRTSRHAADGT